jgi:enterochelin esterase-like enzyme
MPYYSMQEAAHRAGGLGPFYYPLRYPMPYGPVHSQSPVLGTTEANDQVDETLVEAVESQVAVVQIKDQYRQRVSQERSTECDW